jgi:hypothetical protein
MNTSNFQYDNYKNCKVSTNIDDNKNFIIEKFSNCNDLITREILINKDKTKILLVYIEGISEYLIIDEQVLKPLLLKYKDFDNAPEISIQELKKELLTTAGLNEAYTYDQLFLELLTGNLLLFLSGENKALIIHTEKNQGRLHGMADSEQTIRGARDSFVENMKLNIAFIRKRIKNPDLAVEMLKVGRQTATDISLLYLKNIMNPDIITGIKKALESIAVDGVINSSQIEQIIQKHKFTLFPQYMATQRPDRVVGSLLEARAVIILDSTPFVLIVPANFSLFLNSPDDYAGRSIIVSILRFIRYLSYFLATSVSALYLALTTFHPGLLPTQMALSITGTRVGLPLPMVLEVLIMEISLYILQEAAARLPKVMNQTVGIVGGLVIGQAVVQAGLVSPFIVVIVSMSAIASFTMPSYSFALSTIVIRLILITCAAFLGLYGIVMGWIFLLIHVASLENFGVKYLEDFSPFNFDNFKDTIIKASYNSSTKRPDYLLPKDLIRRPKKK